ncbi:uncharacterized protein LOC142520322 [Primulina tabacum]|uniref:uncharacterized protein LOC142520322 n=1 Tax=Primulina tabacum TaxID=48773 RepID=UPI003F5AA60A
MIQNTVQFGGNALDDPNTHIADFLEICDTFKFNGVSDDAVRLRLFPFSLRDKAKSWLNCLPVGSITTWEDMAKAFLLKYFPPSKTMKLQADITTFSQFETMIDAAAYGNLLRKTAEEGYELLEEMAASSYNPQSESNTQRRNAGVHQVTDFSAVTAQLEALNRKIDSMNVNGTAMRLQEIFCKKYGGEHYVKECQDSDNRAPYQATRPKEQVKAIALRSGKWLEQEEKEKEDQREGAVDTSTGKSSKSTPAPTAQSTIAIPPPFSAALKKARLDAQFGKFLEIFKKFHINISFADALMQMQSYAKFLKDNIANERKLEDHMTINLTENCSALVQNKIPPKLKDQGVFFIPCVIGDIVFHKALKLGLGEPKQTQMSLQLADGSVKHPRGVKEDVLVKVGKFTFPTDFVVLDMEEDREVPLILGRPFFETGKAVIEVQEGKLRLRVGKEEITFNDAMKDPLEATLTTELKEDELDEENLQEWRTEPPTRELKPRPPHLKYVYLERTKRAPDKRITSREFKEGETVLLYNSKLRLFPGKLKSRWTGPYMITKVFPLGDITVRDEKNESFTVNAQRLKKYLGGTGERQIGVTRFQNNQN